MRNPQPGTIILFDDVVPPLQAGSYRAITDTTVTVDGGEHSLEAERHLEVEAPRFTLPPVEIAARHPPRNGHGAFENSLPHVVLRRRTLPWDRKLAEDDALPVPTLPAEESPPRGRTPWLALLLFEEDEALLLERVPLEEVVPAAVYSRLGAPPNVSCDAIEVPRDLLRSLLPSVAEIRMLAHARHVDPSHRTPEVGDGWFSVVVANRLPRPGTRHRVCLVSLEQRTDLVAADPPAVEDPDAGPIGEFGELAPTVTRFSARELRLRIPLPGPTAARLVVLAHWTFEGGDATFPELMDRIDVGRFGQSPERGASVPVADTGHVRLTLHERHGTEQEVWYRSPLVPHELARDELGPYHSADQARRVSPETGAEDVTYAAAFEIGRIIGAANARITADLSRWRRAALRNTARRAAVAQTAAELTLADTLEPSLQQAPSPVLRVAALQRMVRPSVRRVDARSDVAAPGLDPEALADAWELPTREDADALLSNPPLVDARRPSLTLPTDVPREPEVERLEAARERLLRPIRRDGDPR